jgi:hypothetical protein
MFGTTADHPVGTPADEAHKLHPVGAVPQATYE